MRIKCPNCGHKAVIQSNHALSAQVHDLYCQCTNVADCGATFVYTVGFSRYLNPPLQTTHQIAAQLIKSLPLPERQALQQELFQ